MTWMNHQADAAVRQCEEKIDVHASIARQPGRTGVVMLALLGVLLAGCKSKQPVDSAPPVPAPSYQQLAEAHNQRIELLQTTYSNGVIWADEKGRLFEQGNMELWLDLPFRTALRVEKLGEVLLWLGSNEQGYWLFDMTGQERVLYAGRHDQPIAVGEDSPVMIRPLVLLDLMGLAPLPTDDHSQQQVEYDREHQAWVVRATSGVVADRERGEPIRMYFDQRTLLPVRVEALSETGDIIASSSLRRYESVRIPGMGVAGFPRMAEMIDIIGQFDGDGQDRYVRIAINQTTVEFDHEQLTRVFDLDRLIRGLQPQRIEGTLPQSAPAAAATR